MSLSLGRERLGLKGFRLSDIPFSVRYAAYERELKSASSLADQIALGRAAHEPSDRVYYIPAAAWEAQARKATWRRKSDAGRR